MTRAICMQCGEAKVGAWTPCTKCGRDVTSHVEQAQAMMLSSQNLSDAELDAAAAKIRAGGRPTFDDARVHQLAAQIAATPEPSKFGFVLLLLLISCCFVGIVLAIIFTIRAVVA